jgi:hypothetical protein
MGCAKSLVVDVKQWDELKIGSSILGDHHQSYDDTLKVSSFVHCLSCVFVPLLLIF